MQHAKFCTKLTVEYSVSHWTNPMGDCVVLWHIVTLAINSNNNLHAKLATNEIYNIYKKNTCFGNGWNRDTLLNVLRS